MEKCRECGGEGEYYTEWSDAADSNPELKALVTYYPDPPTGVVWIKCIHCDAYRELNSASL